MAILACFDGPQLIQNLIDCIGEVSMPLFNDAYEILLERPVEIWTESTKTHQTDIYCECTNDCLKFYRFWRAISRTFVRCSMTPLSDRPTQPVYKFNTESFIQKLLFMRFGIFAYNLIKTYANSSTSINKPISTFSEWFSSYPGTSKYHYPLLAHHGFAPCLCLPFLCLPSPSFLLKKAQCTSRFWCAPPFILLKN